EQVGEYGTDDRSGAGGVGVGGESAGGRDDCVNCRSSENGTSVVALSTRRRLRFLLETLSRELDDCPFYYSLPDVAAAAPTAARELGGSGGDKGGSRGVTGMHLPTVEAVRVSAW
ncbi:unnamed protein product, partial [Sphacelaria rigidula]